MRKRNNPWEKSTYFHRARRENTRSTRDTFLIVCEGTKTEKLYFEAFTVTKVKLSVRGQGRNTESLVQKAIAIRDREMEKGVRFNQVRCVFDKDDFSNEQFNTAIKQAANNAIHVAYSNEAFELWYLLHFECCYTAFTRRDYIARLSTLLGLPYSKASSRMYHLLLSRQEQAIENARKLIQHHTDSSGFNPVHSNPCTNVHKLVEALNSLSNP